MLLSFIVFKCLLLSVLSYALKEQNKKHGKGYISKMDKKMLRILEGHTDTDNFQEVFDMMNDMVENSGGKLELCTKFKEPISIQVSNLPGSFSTEELKWFEDTLETFINENIDELEDLEVHVIRQMEEKKKGGDEHEDLLILIDIYGCYSDRFDDISQEIKERLEEKKDEIKKEESGWTLEMKKDAAVIAVEEALRLKEEEEQKRSDEQKQLEEKQMEDQKKLEEQQMVEAKRLEEEQQKEQKVLEEQQKLEAASKIVDKVQEGSEEKKLEEKLKEGQKQLEETIKLQREKLEQQQKAEIEKLEEEQRLEREKKKEVVANMIDIVQTGLEEKGFEEKLKKEKKQLEDKLKMQREQFEQQQKAEKESLDEEQRLEREKKKEAVAKMVDIVQQGHEEKLKDAKKNLEEKLKLQREQLKQQQKEEKEKLQEEQRMERERMKEAVTKRVDTVAEKLKQKKQKLAEASEELEGKKHESKDIKKIHSRSDYSHSHSHSHSDYSHSHTHASKGKGRKNKQKVTEETLHYSQERHESQTMGYASSFSKYSKQKNEFASLPKELRTKLQSVLSEEALTLSLLPKLRHLPDPYFRNITKIQYISGSFPKGFDEMQLQSYSEYINYEGENDINKNDALSGPNMVVIQSLIVVGVLTLALAVSVFFYVQRNKRGKKEVHIENIRSMKQLKLDSISSGSYGSSKSNSKVIASKRTMSSSTEVKQENPWKIGNSGTISKEAGLATSSRGTGLADLNSNINYAGEKVHGDNDDDDEFTDAEVDAISECSSYVHEFRGECYAPPGKLGVVLDSINNGPSSVSSVVVVHRIKPGSPLDGVLKIMDRIVAIDDIDTSKMNATEITQVMVSKMRKNRKITYIRGGSFGADPHDLDELGSIKDNAYIQ